MPLNDTAVRRDLEKIARKIISKKIWSITDAAQFAGYSRNHMDLKIEQWGWVIIRPGGLKHVYAIDILEKFQELNDIEFPELSAEWYKTFKINHLS